MGSIPNTTEVEARIFPGTSANAQCRGWLFLLLAGGCWTEADADVPAP